MEIRRKHRPFPSRSPAATPGAGEMMQMLGFGAGGGASKSPGGAAGSASAAPPSSSPVAVGPGRPLRLVYCDDKGKFRMDPEAVATLQLVKGPIGVVSVCGRARQGKSFILNQLLGQSSGFQVASTHRPCTKGLWMWSTPIKRTALDGTEYYLLLLDSEGIDAYDQTGTYSTQIFSLAVLLSSLFIYNQMGGIDEAALDRLSLVTEMTKHIRVKASVGRTSTSELGQFFPVFVWLLRDFYLDLAEDNRKITPRDYLELALRPMHVGGKGTTGKNEIRESIRALFPDRECFTLVRPLSDESDLQRLDQISLDRLRPEFRSGLDELTRFVFERTKPKQVGSTVMTGPILAGIAQSFIDAINNGAVPTISSSWQSVEESECRRAYDTATETYMSAFDRTKPPDEVLLRDAHEEAVQKSLALFNDSAVGMGAARQKYEKLLRTFWKKAFEDYKRHVFIESDFACANTIQSMEKKLRETCNSPNVTLDGVVKVLKSLLAEYEKSTHGPAKWQKVANFLHQSLEGPVLDIAKKQLDQIASEKSALMLKYRSNEDKVELLNKQLAASETYKSDYLRHYEEAINDKKKIADEYAIRLSNLQSNCSSLEERCSSLSKTLNAARNESLEWKRKYELGISQQKSSEDQVKAELAFLKSRNSAIDARLAAASEKAASAQEEAAEWKRNFETAVKETKAALEKAANIQEKTNKQAQQREAALREQFSNSIAEKESVIKEKQEKVDQMEQHLASLRSELKISESKVKSYEIEYSTLKYEIRELSEKLDSAKASAQSYEKEASMLKQEKINLEGKYVAEFKRFEEAGERCASAEKEAKSARELADNALAEAAVTQKEKSEAQRVAMERLTQIERTERHVESLERQKADLLEEIQRLRLLVSDANSKVSLLETQLDDRQREIAELLNSTNEQRASTVQVLDNLLDSERTARAEAEKRAEALSLQLRSTQAKLDALQQELTTVRVHETALDSKLKTSSRGKRSRLDEHLGRESVQDMEIDEQHFTRGKKSRSATSPLKTPTQDGGSVFRGEDNDNQSSHQGEVEDYTKFTVAKLKQELTRHGFGLQLLELKSPNKKDILAVYERTVLKK